MRRGVEFALSISVMLAGAVASHAQVVRPPPAPPLVNRRPPPEVGPRVPSDGLTPRAVPAGPDLNPAFGRDAGVALSPGAASDSTLADLAAPISEAAALDALRSVLDGLPVVRKISAAAEG